MTAKGWGWPLNARAAHYFVNGRSLCGRWGYTGPIEDTNHTSDINCATCRRKLVAWHNVSSIYDVPETTENTDGRETV
ncbi:MAG: hypothetical protein GX595_06520 [Lentisphaerae bacterium]|nr:hypothetical protein [Lentisphaerota bacterium]